MELDSVRADFGSWTLASDQKLLEALQSFSKALDDRVTNCIKNVDNLGFEVVQSEITLRNIFNEFLMLGNSQFIENVSISACIGSDIISNFRSEFMMTMMKVKKRTKQRRLVQLFLIRCC